jgi:hypothetical protein
MSFFQTSNNLKLEGAFGDLQEALVKKIFAVSERVLDKSAMEFITANKQTIRYLHLPMKDSNPEG